MYDLLYLTALLTYGYIFGSVPVGLLLCRLAGYGDIRRIGSGNIGATNVLRTGNKTLAFMTLVLDAGKGVIPIALYLTLAYLQNTQLPYYDPAWSDFSSVSGISPASERGAPFVSSWLAGNRTMLMLIGLGAVLGHNFPLWLGFKGGKGVATTLGTYLAAIPAAGLAACLCWLGAAFLCRISSLAALVSLGLTPLFAYIFYGAAPAILCLIISALAFLRHKANIIRLIKGIEPRIGAKETKGATAGNHGGPGSLKHSTASPANKEPAKRECDKG